MQRRGPNAVRRALSYPLSRVGTTGKSRSHAKRQEGEEGGEYRSHAKTRRRKEDRDPGICDAVGRGFFWLVIFRLIALRLGVLSDSGREDRF